MSLKIWCVLCKNDNTLTVSEVDIDPTASVSSFKNAIRAKWVSCLLKDVDASDLTLVRLYKGVVGGMTKRELKQSKEALQLGNYSKSPERAKDTVSIFSDVRGACLVKDELIFKVMNTMDQVSYFTDSLPAKLCHVLVLIPMQSPPTNSRQFLTTMQVEWKNSFVTRHYYLPEMQLFHLESDYLKESGLVPATKLILYCRSTFHDQFNFLKKQVMDNAHLGWILGPPGTGKSTTSLAFISVIPTLCPGWKVTWIHLSQLNYPVCVRFDGAAKASCLIQDTNIHLLRSILNQIPENHAVFVDGFVFNGLNHVDVLQCCYAWRSQNPTSRRLVFICSMLSRGETSLDDDSIHCVQEFFVYSWKLEEYLSSAQFGDLIEAVKQNLDSSVLTAMPLSNSSEMSDLCNSPPEELVISKFHFAGGNSRFMFDYQTAVVISYLEESVNEVPDVLVYLKRSAGDCSKNVVNRLFGCYSNDGIKHPFIVSRYAATLLAIRDGPDLISKIARATRHDRIDDWFLEMWVFASLQNGGLQVYPKTMNEGALEFEFWEEAPRIQALDPTNLESIPNGTSWWKPTKWSQGGYDAVLMVIDGYDDVQNKRRGSITFIQVSSGDTHSFKIEVFHQLLLALMNSDHGYIIDDLNIIFLVEKSKLQTFQIGKVTGSGLLCDFKWPKDKETEFAAVYGVDRFRQ
ncbi:hypothetical protein BDR26DRAFT_876705 [Obelidium mucronatum]|nr:hypothetical protein BDR26DRAFT_876705 [Obelidium mucronatum]